MNFEDKNLLDSFADTALMALLDADDYSVTPESVALRAYEVAGAMMQARNTKFNQIEFLEQLGSPDVTMGQYNQDETLGGPYPRTAFEAQRAWKDPMAEADGVDMRGCCGTGECGTNCVSSVFDEDMLEGAEFENLLNKTGINFVKLDSEADLVNFLAGLEACDDEDEIAEYMDEVSKNQRSH